VIIDWKKNKGVGCFTRDKQLSILQTLCFVHDPKKDDKILLALVNLIKVRLKSPGNFYDFYDFFF
jgi:hypothetical protein